MKEKQESSESENPESFHESPIQPINPTIPVGLKHFSSFEALDAWDIQLMAERTPYQRMEFLNKLIHITHGDDLSEYEKAFHNTKIKVRQLV